ncbi:MAG: YdcF family protein [Phycicoccus sp.]|nr:YdcF family protein [Phycicoccus sp.]
MSTNTDSLDAAFVLGAGRGHGGGLTAMARGRLEAGASLVRSGVAQRLVIMGGFLSGWDMDAKPSSVPAVAAPYRYLRDAGIDARQIIASSAETRDTIGEAIAASAIARQHDFRRFGLVTSERHMPRALYVFKRFLEDQGTVVDFSVRDGVRLSAEEEGAYLAITRSVLNRLPSSLPVDWNAWRMDQTTMYDAFSAIRIHFSRLEDHPNEAYDIPLGT